jgi:hypothetical protein
MGGFLDWVKCMSNTWKGVLVIGSALVVGASAATGAAAYVGVPGRISSVEKQMNVLEQRQSILEESFEELVKTLNMHTCLQLADRKPGLDWEECLLPSARALLRDRGGEP